ncbi:MAG: DUF5667 domain-containing protein [bacterium]|nr:DUF5667 domain-containing protein [bacterium]
MKTSSISSLRGSTAVVPVAILHLFILSIALILPVSAFAATTAGVKPGSFFYIFDTVSEKIALFFSFNPEAKAKKALEYADERLAEVEAIAGDKNPDAVKAAIADYEGNVALATEKSKEVKDKGQAESLFAAIEDGASRNQEVLSAVLIRVPEEARAAIEQAIEASKKGQEEAAKQIVELKGEVEKLRREVAELKAKDEEKQVTEVEKLKQEVEELKSELIKKEVEENKKRVVAPIVPTKSTTPSFAPQVVTPTPVTTSTTVKPLEITLINATSTFDAMLFEWMTNKPTNSKVFLSSGNLPPKIYDSESGLSTRHIVHVSNLEHNTSYSYEIESVIGIEVAKTHGTLSTRSTKNYAAVIVNPSPCRIDMDNKKVCSIEVFYFEFDQRVAANKVTISAADGGMFIGSAYIDRFPELNRFCSGGISSNSGAQMQGPNISCPTLLSSVDGKPSANFVYYPSGPGTREIIAIVNGVTGVALTQQ